MKGVVDFAISPRIAGWVKTPLDGAAVQVYAYRGDERFECIVRERPDLRLSGNGGVGFEVHIAGGFRPVDLLSGRIRLEAFAAGERSNEIELWRPLRIAAELDALSPGEMAKLSDYLPTSFKSVLSDNFFGINGLETGHNDELVVGVGAISDDKVAVVGRGGHFFLYKGSNNVFDLYKADSANPALVAAWRDVINERLLFSRNTGIDFLQIFIPEKSTLLQELVPYKLSGPTCLWSRVVSCEKHDCGEAIIDALSLFSHNMPRSSIYRTGDTHFSSFGAFAVAKELVKRLGMPSDTFYGTGSSYESLRGDLASRFWSEGSRSSEWVELYSEVVFDGRSLPSPELVSKKIPDVGYQGTHYIWKNSAPAFKRRVICFGNSFFERGFKSTSITWWLARLFEEFHFVWSSDFDYEMIDQVKPDIVMCQTIERFLGRCPVS